MTRRNKTPPESGAALLVAVVAIAILSSLAVDLAYETQVRLRIAANARDDLRASALAQSAVNVSRLVLSFQSQLDQALDLACSATQAASAAAATATGTGTGTTTTATPTGCLRPQLWSLIPVSSTLTQTLFGDEAEAAKEKGKGKEKAKAQAEGAPALPSATYGDFEGGFEAKIEDEGQRINLQLDALRTDGTLGAQVEALLELACDSKWDPLFDRTDADGQRYSRTDLVTNLRDWVNTDKTTSVLAASFPGGNCSFLVPTYGFDNGFGDKNYPYDRGPDRYKVKNNRMDSVDELYLVAGVTDAYMAAFGDQFTVYLPKSAALNVNSDDPAQQLLVARLMADPSSLTRLLDPAFIEAYKKAYAAARMGGFLSVTQAQLVQILESLDVKVRTEYETPSLKSPFTDRSVVYRIRALGVAGDVTHETLAVVSYDPKLTAADRPALGAASQPPMGRLIHWHEE
jgi:general secretion pathway protein K